MKLYHLIKTIHRNGYSEISIKTLESEALTLIGSNIPTITDPKFLSSADGSIITGSTSENRLEVNSVHQSDNIIVFDRLKNTKKTILNSSHYWSQCANPIISSSGKFIAFTCTRAHPDPQNPAQRGASIVVYNTDSQIFDFIMQDSIREQIGLYVDGSATILGMDDNGLSFTGTSAGKTILARYLFGPKKLITTFQAPTSSQLSVNGPSLMRTMFHIFLEDFNTFGSKYYLITPQ